MNDTVYTRYQSKNIVLAKTMVLKLDNVAKYINTDLKSKGYEVDESRPETWKYYLNLFGEYHQYDKDRLLALSNGKHDQIRIKVAGDNQPVEVDFNKELIFGESSDLTIANEYRFNTQYYNSLLELYPEFTTLIRGLLNPIPPDVAIGAYEGEVLYCGGYMKTLGTNGKFGYVRQEYGIITEDYLIESNELNLIGLIQKEIDVFISRWYNAGYYESAALYYPTFLATLALHCVHVIHNARLSNVKSQFGFTHSFYIYQHLDSNGELGWVTQYLPKKVVLWLYRNWMWLDANKGKQMTFKAIVDNVLTPSNIPLSGYKYIQDLTVMNDPDNPDTQPTPMMLREVINFKHTGSGTDLTTVTDILTQERHLAKDNMQYLEEDIVDVTAQGRYANFDKLDTKVLESTVIDLSNNMEITIDDIAMNYWLFAATHGFYHGTVIAVDPLTNERIQLTPLNAYILAFYCFNKGWANAEIEKLPLLTARWIPRDHTYTPGSNFNVKPSLKQMKFGTSSDHILESELVDIMGNFVPKFKHGSSVSIGSEILRTHKEAMRQYFAYTKIHEAVGRAHGQATSHYQWWWDVPCQLGDPNVKYKDWLLSHGFDLSGYSREDLVTLGLNLVSGAITIAEDSSEEIANKQNAALAVLKHFASYTIHIIQTTTSTDSFMMGSTYTRVSDFKQLGQTEEKIQLPNIDIKPTVGVYNSLMYLNNRGGFEDFDIQTSMYGGVKVDNSNFLYSMGNISEVSNIRLPDVSIIDVDVPYVEVDNRVKMYSNLTTNPYPEYSDTTLAIDLMVEEITLESPPLPSPTEPATLVASFMDIETIEIIKVSESVAVGNMVKNTTKH